MIDYPQFILAFSLFTVAMLATPGPNNATLLAVGISHGFKATLPHTFACVFTGVFILLVTGTGLGELFNTYPPLFKLLQVCGAIYMVWLSARIAGINISHHIRNALSKKQREIKVITKNMGMQPLTFVQGTVFQLVNIKAWMSCIVGVSTYGGNDEIFWVRLWIMAITFLVLGFPCAMIWGAGGAFMGRFLTGEGMRRLNYLFAFFLLASIVLIFI